MSQKTFTSDMSGTPDNSHYQQFVLNRANMTDPFSDNDYNSCIEALEKNNAVAINWNQGTTRQLQLVTKSNTGVLKFAYVRGNVVETWTVAASSPHTITNEQHTIGAPATYVNESYTDPDAHIDYDGSLLSLTCDFDVDAVKFTGLVHVRFNIPSGNFTVTQYIDNQSNGIISTSSSVSGATHITMPVIIEQGKLKIRVGFDALVVPSNVKFDLIGFNH